MLTDYGRVAGQVVMESETWKAATFQAIGTDGGAKFQTVLDQDQQWYVLEHIPSDLLGIT